MSETKNTGMGDRSMDERLWDYLDGFSSADERSSIERLIETSIEWRNKHHELLEIHKMIHSSELEQPSLRFTRNVMEEIAKYQIAPATKTYINKRVVWGIASFFILLIVGFLVYGFGQMIFTGDTSTTNEYVDFTKVDYSKMFNNTYINIFMMVNVVLGLVLLDRWLANRRKNAAEFTDW